MNGTDLYSYQALNPCADIESLCEALFGGDCPTEGMVQYIISGTDLAPTFAVIGTKHGCRDVIFHLYAERVLPSTVYNVVPWPPVLQRFDPIDAAYDVLNCARAWAS